MTRGGGGASKRTKREQGAEMTLGVELWGLLKEVLESNWLLHKLWQSVEEVEKFHSKVCRLVRGLERVELL